MNLHTRLNKIDECCRRSVVENDLLHGYFMESIGIIRRLLDALDSMDDVSMLDWQRDVYLMEAEVLLDFLRDEIDVHNLRKQLKYVTVNATDAGLVGDASKNNRPAFDRLMSEYRNDGKPLRILFPAGDYYFACAEGEASGSIVLEDIENLLIEGLDGARIITSGAYRAGDCIRMDRCRNIIIRNLIMDMDPLPFAFGKIIEKEDAASTIDIELLPNSPEPDESYGTGGQVTIRKAGTYHFVREAGNGLAARNVERLGDRRYRMHLVHANMQSIPAGYTAVWHTRGRSGSGQGLSIRHSRHILLENVKMHAAPTTCVWPEYSGGLQFINCDFVPPDDRPALVNADGFHVPGNLKGPYLENCRIFGPADDCLNFYSPTFSVADWSADERSVILLVDFPGDQMEFFRPGDPIAFINSNSGDIAGPAVVKDAKIIDWAQDEPPVDTLRCEKRALQLTLDREVNDLLTRKALGRPAWSPYHEYWKTDTKAWQVAAAIDAPYEHLAVNLRYTNSGFIIRNCRFGYNRALGFKCKAGNGVIRDSHFIDQALLFEISLTWREGFLPHDIEVTNTKIDWFCVLQLGLLGKTLKGDTFPVMPRISLENCVVQGRVVNR